ncbi:phosphotransferase [Paenibacillus sp. MZ04-78.2]|uniref:phosphotransferase enzyme family protein n=1 Tax=Paenibacillus sp. MZ04-78.2 TaxID=2962034 RepID=UPI0020B646CF|nr:phosphotransferase [Paenibacillus sp. MZ04-78.2]MCP3774021.1 phosphotransferase [Paenibacillus sp. MZ04-78.2]
MEKVFKTFLFDVTEEPKSIYPYAPVYKVDQGDESYIVKHTASPIEEAMKVANFVGRLHKLGVPIVAPVPMSVDNPQQVDETVWVVYPFIKGKSYTGKDEEIYEAGKLLGRIHSLSSKNNEEGLDIYDEFELEEEEILEDLEKIIGYAENRGIPLDDGHLSEQMLKIIEQQETLKALELPSVATPYDYKADNLIYNDSAKPYLIDPDNATFLPRIYDLALALLLFHNALDTAPDRIFDINQWSLFKKGYFEFVEITDIERTHWQDVVKHIFLDEVIWLLADFEEGWDDQRQVNFFNSLLSLLNDMESYDLK